MSRQPHIDNTFKGPLLLMVLCLFIGLGALAQQPDKRHVTPVKPETNQVKPPPKGTDEKIIQQYISGDSAAAVAEARKDSLRRVYKHYPLLTDFSVGLNFAEPLFMIFGQSYGNVDVNATLNMWNRLQPTIELGLGWANSSPEDEDFSYKCKPSPYFKVGVNYNFMFKNSPDYQALFGLRLGYSPFSYDMTYTISSTNHLNVSGQSSYALWGEAGIGLKVKLWDRLSMGWMARYHGIFNYGKSEDSSPWFVPGYGPRTGSLGFSFSIYYTLPIRSRAKIAISPDEAITTTNQNQNRL